MSARVLDVEEGTRSDVAAAGTFSRNRPPPSSINVNVQQKDVDRSRPGELSPRRGGHMSPRRLREYMAKDNMGEQRVDAEIGLIWGRWLQLALFIAEFALGVILHNNLTPFAWDVTLSVSLDASDTTELVNAELK